MRTSILAAALLAAAAVSLNGGAARGDVRFVRAEVNGDGILDISDAVHTLILLFLTDAGDPKCPDALDANDDGAADISDAIHILGFLFLGVSLLAQGRTRLPGLGPSVFPAMNLPAGSNIAPG